MHGLSCSSLYHNRTLFMVLHEDRVEKMDDAYQVLCVRCVCVVCVCCVCGVCVCVVCVCVVCVCVCLC